MKRQENLEEIPGVGKKIAAKLRVIGIDKVSDLEGREPEALYVQLMRGKGCHVDRCVLYVFRAAVY